MRAAGRWAGAWLLATCCYFWSMTAEVTGVGLVEACPCPRADRCRHGDPAGKGAAGHRCGVVGHGALGWHARAPLGLAPSPRSPSRAGSPARCGSCLDHVPPLRRLDRPSRARARGGAPDGWARGTHRPPATGRRGPASRRSPVQHACAGLLRRRRAVGCTRGLDPAGHDPAAWRSAYGLLVMTKTSRWAARTGRMVALTDHGAVSARQGPGVRSAAFSELMATAVVVGLAATAARRRPAGRRSGRTTDAREFQSVDDVAPPDLWACSAGSGRTKCWWRRHGRGRGRGGPVGEAARDPARGLPAWCAAVGALVVAWRLVGGLGGTRWRPCRLRWPADDAGFRAPAPPGVGLPAALSSVDRRWSGASAGGLAGRSTRWSRWSR